MAYLFVIFVCSFLSLNICRRFKKGNIASLMFIQLVYLVYIDIASFNKKEALKSCGRVGLVFFCYPDKPVPYQYSILYSRNLDLINLHILFWVKTARTFS